ncbi:MAG: NAD-dependent epimerase/dehydratase family protein [Phycisphaerales bacterium]|nr:NAD-dependent epimerase/dehydratase family protein [Phycisphaerales bacterium]
MNPIPQHILVTGGAGFIGSHLVEQLLALGAQVTVVDDLSTGDETNLVYAKQMAGDRLQFIRATVSNALVKSNIPRCHEVYHLAAAVGVRLIVERASQSIETNVLETSAAIRWALRDGAKLLVASSSEVYGKGVRVPFMESDDVVFGPTTSSRWSYGYSKALDEFLTLAAVTESNLQAVIVRFFNTVGPRQKGEWGMVLPRFIQAALAGNPLEVHGDGSQQRCFCDVRDVAPALIQLLRSPQCIGRVLNMGSDEMISMRELAERVIRNTGSTSRIQNVSYEQVFGKGFEDLKVRQPSLQRIRDAIGFAPRISLDTTITDIAAVLRGARTEERAA